ncbi:MAG TPA: dTDP-4-dehydrorhamnose 3,5-epimerase [Actinomycetota bacterium]|jgi:dTDP-4-dehydrorhamnose 3,5-epimerase
MIFTETDLKGSFVVGLEPIEDARGFFARAWAADELAGHDLEDRVVQCSLSLNRRAGTLRGLHFQRAPHAEAKFVRCIRGALWDVIVDLRRDSPTYRRWVGAELSASNRLAMYVPRGFAHGFQTLADDTEAFYMISDPYVPDAGGGYRWDDPAFGIEWPLGAPTEISDRDRSWPEFPA